MELHTYGPYIQDTEAGKPPLHRHYCQLTYKGG